jgi:hypothetical protein
VATVPPADPQLPVAGCVFQIPFGAGTKPQPCVKVQWANISARVTVLGRPLFLQALPPTPGNGLCVSIDPFPQWPPLLKKLQTRVFAT